MQRMISQQNRFISTVNLFHTQSVQEFSYNCKSTALLDLPNYRNWWCDLNPKHLLYFLPS